MGGLILITGGSRSGKSAFAERLAMETAQDRLYIATCPRFDDPELLARIDRHCRDRRNKGWRTVEEPLDLAGALVRNARAGVILVDCLTLWVNNLMYQAGRKAMALDEDGMGRQAAALLQAARQHAATVLFVSNEVGLGVVPDNPQARLYRDLVGRCNQIVAAGADTVYLVSCGIPLRLK